MQVFVPRYLLDMKKAVSLAISETRAESALQLLTLDKNSTAVGANAELQQAQDEQGRQRRRRRHPSVQDVARRAGVSVKAVRDLLAATSLSLTGLAEGGEDASDAGFEDAQLMKVRWIFRLNVVKSCLHGNYAISLST